MCVDKGEMNNEQGYRSSSILCFIDEYFLIHVLDAHVHVYTNLCIFICAPVHVCADDHGLCIQKPEVNFEYCDLGMSHLISLFYP